MTIKETHILIFTVRILSVSKPAHHDLVRSIREGRIACVDLDKPTTEKIIENLLA